MQKLECYTVNPYGKEPFNNDMYYPASMKIMGKIKEEWQEAEKSTFAKWAVLIKKI